MNRYLIPLVPDTLKSIRIPGTPRIEHASTSSARKNQMPDSWFTEYCAYFIMHSFRETGKKYARN